MIEGLQLGRRTLTEDEWRWIIDTLARVRVHLANHPHYWDTGYEGRDLQDSKGRLNVVIALLAQEWRAWHDWGAELTGEGVERGR